MTRDQIQLHPGLFQAILADPADDLRRLVYADWLDDQGDHQRADFVRVQVELASINCIPPKCSRYAGQMACDCPECSRYYDAREQARPLETREQELLAQHWPRWTSETFGTKKVSAAGNLDAIRVVLDGAELDVAYRRGFIGTVRLPLEAWIGRPCDCPGLNARIVHEQGVSWDDCPFCHGTSLTGAHGPRLVAAAPLERVEVSDREAVRVVDTGLYTITNLPRFLYRSIASPSVEELKDRLSKALLAWASHQPASCQE